MDFWDAPGLIIAGVAAGRPAGMPLWKGHVPIARAGKSVLTGSLERGYTAEACRK